MDANNVAVMIVYLCSTILNAAYFLPIVYKAFFCSDEESMFEKKMAEAPFCCVLPICITAIMTCMAFFKSGNIHSLAK